MISMWVIGSGGLLGQALTRGMEMHPLYIPAEPFAWPDEPLLERQFRNTVKAFEQHAADAPGWVIFWAAGIGNFASGLETMQQETRALNLLLGALRDSVTLRRVPGCIVLASSAGAIYAGSKDFVITEFTAPAPTTHYAREKLIHESLLWQFSKENDSVHILLARISTIYGRGQSHTKAQGLVTHIARAVLHGKPIHIYVPYDTIRDYITVEDVSSNLISAAQNLVGHPGVTFKLITSETPTTIAEIIAVFKKISKRNPRIITSATQLSKLYNRRILFKSSVFIDGMVTVHTPLLIGISNLMQDERKNLRIT